MRAWQSYGDVRATDPDQSRNPNAAVRSLVLLGGGHSHVEVVRRMSKVARDTRITLVSPSATTPYSGMLPGCIAGHYQASELLIDVSALCRHAGVEFHLAAATAVDIARQEVQCTSGRRIGFDILSVNIGSVTAPVPGAAEHAVSIRPAGAFLAAWESLLRTAGLPRRAPLHISVIGGGSGGVEIILAMQHRLQRLGLGKAVAFTLLTAGSAVVENHSQQVSRLLHHILVTRGIKVEAGSRVTRITHDHIYREASGPLAADYVVCATGAAAPHWLAASGLTTDPAGYLLVADTLQSTGDPAVFAAGDIATIDGDPCPRSGVYAVRQGPPLAVNLQRALKGNALLHYRPQRQALALISTGGRQAVASYGNWSAAGSWVWQWKNYIDRRFVARYALHTG